MSRLMLRRAETIKRKAEQLALLVNATYGLESYPSDMADNLCETVGDLIEAIERRALSTGGKK